MRVGDPRELLLARDPDVLHGSAGRRRCTCAATRRPARVRPGSPTRRRRRLRAGGGGGPAGAVRLGATARHAPGHPEHPEDVGERLHAGGAVRRRPMRCTQAPGAVEDAVAARRGWHDHWPLAPARGVAAVGGGRRRAGERANPVAPSVWRCRHLGELPVRKKQGGGAGMGGKLPTLTTWKPDERSVGGCASASKTVG